LTDGAGGVGRASVVGRESVLARLDQFVRDRPAGGTIVLVGGAGIGKTTLWEAAVGSARAGGARVLTARPSGSAAQLPFGGLIDLCDGLEEAEFAAVPPPQRRALEAALLRAEPPVPAASTTAVALGLLGVVRTLAARAPVIIAIDDLPWLDAPSAEALAFVARRVDETLVKFLLARRPGRVGALESMLSRAGVERVQLDPLSLGAVRRLLFERFGLTMSRHHLVRVVELTGGNPLFALEVGRSLVDRDRAALDDDLPLSESLEDMLGNRVAQLPATVRRVLLAVALSEDPRADQLVGIIDERALDDALDTGAVVIDGQRVRASHPLLAAAAEKRSRAGERRRLHLALSETARDEPTRAMHLALAATTPDEALAARVAAAADIARARGARQQAALLAGHGLRLTAASAEARARRVLDLAERLDDAGELRRMTALLNQELASLPPGSLRARAWMLLSESDAVRSRDEQEAFLEQALTECGEDRNLRARVLVKRAGNAAVAGVANLAQAEAWAIQALEDAQESTVSRYALWALAFARGLTGRGCDDLCAQSAVAADPTAYISASAERVAAYRLVWRGELADARASSQTLLELADERGDPTSYAMVRMQTVVLELRAGRLDAAAHLLDEWAESSDFETQFRPQYPRCRALLEAVRGAVAEATRWAEETIRLAQAAGSRWDELEARRALGTAALVEPTPDEALAALWPVWEHCEREGVLDPGVFPVAPELVEALVEKERFDDARAITHKLEERGARQGHPWALASAKRCTALVQLAEAGYAEASAARLAEASVELEQLGFIFDRARCQLALGRIQRRVKQWRNARQTLEQAAGGFAALGADGWAQRARSELERVGGRRRTEGELTPSERRVVELAAEGLSNKEIAAALYVTVNTVEVYLARAFTALGVRSRAQLAKRLAAGWQSDGGE
jgi:DNA-binding CsgD family transcriptional regulator